MEQLFNAIGAQELKIIILKSLEKAIDESGHFESHITFPKVNWDFRLEVKVYPSPTPDRLVTDKGEIDKEPVTETQARNAKILTFTQKEGIDTPDLAREQNALPIPTPKPGPDGIIGDAAVLSPAEPNPPQVELRVRSASEPEISPEAEILVEGLPEDPNSVDAAMEIARSCGGTVTDAQRDAIYAAPPIPRDAKAASVTIANKANPKGVRVEPKGKGGPALVKEK